MSIGPVQLLVVGFDQPEFKGEILAELRRLKEADLIRLIDAMVVYKDVDGEVMQRQFTDLSAEEAQMFGALVGGLVGLGAAGEEGAELGAEAGAEAAAEGHLLDPDTMIDVIEEIPRDSAAAIALIEHRWAIPLRDAILAAGGIPIVDEWVHPRDLVAIGLLAAEEVAAG